MAMQKKWNAPSLPPANVLLVDDRYENLVSLKAILESPELNIVTANSGNEALAKVLEMSFACILLDVEMPHLSGWEVAQILNQDPVLQSVPIILVSAYRKEDLDVFKGYESGVVDYLIKPVEPAIVRGKVRVFADLFRKQQMILQLNESLQLANEDLRQFTKVAAHDLKEPARMVAMFCQLAERGVKEKGKEAALEHLGVAVEGARRMCSLIDDLVAFLNVRDNSYRRQLVDLGKVVEEVIQENSEMIGTRSAHVECDSLPLVYGNRAELKLVVSNLLTNALQFRGDAPLSVSFSAQPLNGEVVISVKDTSEGLDRQLSDRIFELFHRGDPQAEGTGNGLGLALCRQVVEKHGGRIWVESSKGKGNTFFFSLPEYESVSPSGLCSQAQ